MGNNCQCIGKNEENVCQTQSSNGSVRIQPYPNRKIFDDQLTSRRFTLEPIKSTSSAAPHIRSDSTKRSANVYNPDSFSMATETLTYQSDQQNAITYSIFQSSPPRRQSDRSTCVQSNCSPQSSNKKRVSKIFSNPQSTAAQTPNSSRRQTFHEQSNFNNHKKEITLQNIDINIAPMNVEKAEWSLSPVISPRSKFFAKNVQQAAIQQTFEGVQCDVSDVIDFRHQNGESREQNENKSSFTTDVFEVDFTRNSDLETAFKELKNKQKNNKMNNFARITELTLEDDEDETQSPRLKEHKLYTSTIREETSLTYSESSICNISSLTPEQMQIVKSKYYQFESSNSDKSTQIFDAQSYHYSNRIVHSRDQVFSPQRLSTLRASDSILSETVKRLSNLKEQCNLVIA